MGGGRGRGRSKGVMMQVLIKRLFPQERRVEDCEFNKRKKKKKASKKNFFLISVCTLEMLPKINF